MGAKIRACKRLNCGKYWFKPLYKLITGKVASFRTQFYTYYFCYYYFYYLLLIILNALVKTDTIFVLNLPILAYSLLRNF